MGTPSFGFGRGVTGIARGVYLTVAGMIRCARSSSLIVALLVAIAVLAGCGGGGDEQSGNAGLPGDFPTAQVPLVTGTVLSADGNRADGWSVTVQGGPEAGNVLDTAVQTLTEQGYTESQRTSDGDRRVVILSATKNGDTYWVQVGTTPGAAGTGAVFYQITAGR